MAHDGKAKNLGSDGGRTIALLVDLVTARMPRAAIAKRLGVSGPSRRRRVLRFYPLHRYKCYFSNAYASVAGSSWPGAGCAVSPKIRDGILDDARTLGLR